MMNQTIEFIYEQIQSKGFTGKLSCLNGMRYWDPEKYGFNILLDYKFEDRNDVARFHSAGVKWVEEILESLALSLDMAFNWSEIQFLGDFGVGPIRPLVKVLKHNYSRGVGFELEERGMATAALNKGVALSDYNLKLSLSHYTTGMSLLALEDHLPGLIDGAFMQFYQSIEVILEKHKKELALEQGIKKFSEKFDKKLYGHVYDVRNTFFAHSKASTMAIKRAYKSYEDSFEIAKQVLVARWAARNLISLSLDEELLQREMRLYTTEKNSICFRGDSDQLDNEFSIVRD